MKAYTRLLSQPILYLLTIAAGMMVTQASIQAMGTDLIWFVVTSENNAGPGTLRDAIDTINSVGTAIGGTGTEGAPNAIAFAKNVKVIHLQNPLPLLEVPVLIDGLAKVSNGTVVQEGDCSILPSPAEDPCSFSCALRVTIDGSAIPSFIASDRLVGLESNSDDVTIRGIRIIHITTSDPDSIAIGINLNGMNNRVECCEIDTIHNTAGSSDSPNENFAAGITGSDEYYVDKTYVHNIQGGLITVECELIPDNSELVSGSAYGITGQIHVTNSRVEQVESGSIIACTPDMIGSEMGITLNVGTAAGIFFRSFEKQACPEPVVACSECVGCPLSGSDIAVSVEDSVVTSIIGGSIISSVNNVTIVHNNALGISFLGAFFNYFIHNNSLSVIHAGSATLSGNNTEYRRFGIGGILAFIGNISCIRCNTVTDVSLGILQSSGYNATIDPGIVVGISSANNEDIIECNSISLIQGGSTLLQGDCSILLLPGETVKSKEPNKIANIPGGATCFPEIPGSTVGISSVASGSALIANNTVHSIFGGKRVMSSAGTQAATLGSIGISVGSQTTSPPFSLLDGNSVYAISGPLLAAKAGGSLIQNLQGTVGITVNSFITEVQNNCVQQISEGPVQVSQQSIVTHFTDLQELHLKAPTVKQTITNPDTWFVPVITAGIAVAGPESNRTVTEQIDPATGPPYIRIHDNTISTVTGAVIPGGQLPLGSVGIGIFAQPSFAQITEQSFALADNITKDSVLEEICAENRLLNFIVGDLNTNTIQTISGGTNAPAYGICLDGSRLSLFSLNIGSLLLESLFSIDNNTIKILKGNGRIEPFILTDQQLNAILSCCVDTRGSGSECDLPNNFVPLLPFEPTSGIYTLFGGCSQISSNTITNLTDSQEEARGITTAASSDMDLFDNTLSQIKGYGIFVGGAFVDAALLTGTEFIFEELLPSLRNKIYNNATVNNTDKGIELGLIDWNYFVFARTILDACKQVPLRVHQEAPEDSVATYGNHGQVAPCIRKVTCNSNGTITIDALLTSTLPVTKFTIQFFKNSSNGIPHGEQHISLFDDPNLVLRTDIQGNARAQFTFLPLLPVENGDIISAHVTVKNDPLSPAGNSFFGDTSEFSQDTSIICPVSSLLLQKPSKPNKPSFVNLCYRTQE